MTNAHHSIGSGTLDILVLGGTGFLGPHFVRAAVERGHRVSVFNRGKSDAQLPRTVERLLGDRSGDLTALQNCKWDAAVDLSTFVPDRVRSLGEALKGCVKHYIFISTVASYEPCAPNEKLSESGRQRHYDGKRDPYLVAGPQDDHEYGALKALCEREAEKQFPERTLILRPGYIVGAADPQPYLTYWPARMAHGGEIMVVGDPWMPVQFIDARDLSEWCVRMIEKKTTGIYNAVGPAEQLTLCALIQQALATAPPSAHVTWVSPSWLTAQKNSELWEKLLFWSHESAWAWCRRLNNERALAHGLSMRPLRVTLADAFAAHQSEPAEKQGEILSRWTTKRDGTGMEKVTVSWAEYLGREQEMLARWHALRPQCELV